MVSFVSGTLLKKELCCKFMLKCDIKNYFQQFTKTSIICFQWNTTYIDLLMCKYVWLEQSNICAKYGILSDKNIRFIGQNLQTIWSCLKSKALVFTI